LRAIVLDGASAHFLDAQILGTEKRARAIIVSSARISRLHLAETFDAPVILLTVVVRVTKLRSPFTRFWTTCVALALVAPRTISGNVACINAASLATLAMAIKSVFAIANAFTG